MSRRIAEIDDEEQRRLLAEAGAAMKRAREERGLSQEEAALRAGVDQSALSHMERVGPHAMSWNKILALTSALGVHVRIDVEEH